MEPMKPALTAEQQARDILERIGVEDAQSFSAGELVELANLISAAKVFTREDVALIRDAADTEIAYAFEQGDTRPDPTPGKLRALADRIEALLPPVP